MAETVKRYREPVAWTVLGVSVVYILMSLVRGGLLLAAGTPVVESARAIGGSSLSIVMVLLCLAAGLSCVLVQPATRRGGATVRAAALVVTTAAVLATVFLAMGLFGARGGIVAYVLEIVGGLLEIAIKIAAATLLWGAARSFRQSSPEALPDSSTPAAISSEPEPAAEDEQPELQEASWKADQAVGAVWTRAGDAATGAAASGWGSAARSSGWDVADKALPAPERVKPAELKGPWATAGELATGTDAPAGPSAPADAHGGEDVAVQWRPASPDR